ncbi:MAG: hypothetical protein S4CHLAM2_16000 [Chlamydiales bacterium]|nr:hypothetical protein [Chlamydiales bacterium]
MFILAQKEDEKRIAYFDASGNKYLAEGGTLAWRLNNPGLVPSRSPIAKKSGSIGGFKEYAIFPSPEKGREALEQWLQLKKFANRTLRALGKCYQPNDPEAFVEKLHALGNLPKNQKLHTFSAADFALLIRAIEKLCNFTKLGNEKFSLLPRIIGKIDNGPGKKKDYLISGGMLLSKRKAIEWIQTHRLDASLVHGPKGKIYLRSRRPVRHIKKPLKRLPKEERVTTLARVVGQKKEKQTIWGFINGIYNTKERALRSAHMIADAAGGATVYSLPNDTQSGLDLLTVLAQKSALDTPVIHRATHFFRYLIALADQTRPVVIFAHSQGAIICERALKHLSKPERMRLTVFSFGGGSFIAPGACHPDSHNYASAADPICRLGSPKLQILALERYTAQKRGIEPQEMLFELARRDALLKIDSLNPRVIETYTQKRCRYYEKELAKIRNVTILDPDPGCSFQHAFESTCYQMVVQSLVNKYS